MTGSSMTTSTLDTPVERRTVQAGAFAPAQLVASLPEALRKLDPRAQLRNPVMFVVWVGSALTTVLAVLEPSVFSVLIAVWLWLTVLFANLAEAVAEGRGKAQAESLRRTKKESVARRLAASGAEDAADLLAGSAIETVPGTDLRIGDRVVVEAGEVIPGDGDVVEGIATVDESAITGESAPVIRESGGDRSSVTGGTTVLSDRIVVEITTKPGESFVDRMIALVEGAERQKTPNEIALTILLSALTIIFLLAVVALQPMAGYSGAQQSLIVLTALLVCLIPTTIGALLSAIGIAGMDRLVQRNVLATSGRAVEAAGDVDVLLLDKTGTITFGNRQATDLHAVDGVGPDELAAAARLSSLADTTPEGLAGLKPSFAQLGADAGFDDVALEKYHWVEKIDHVHHAGNSSGIVDGAALVLVGSEQAGKDMGLTPRARIVATATSGADSTIMLTGPIPATEKLLAKTGLSVDDIDLFELNEAFASVVLNYQKKLHIPDEKLNVNGGAIAMGHPLGATGAMILGTMVDELERRGARRAVITLCIGGGMGVATLIERV